MDFTHIIQETRQFFQGRPTYTPIQEGGAIQKVAAFSSPPSPPLQQQQPWLSKKEILSSLPSDVESHYNLAHHIVNNRHSACVFESENGSPNPQQNLYTSGTKRRTNVPVEAPLDLNVKTDLTRGSSPFRSAHQQSMWPHSVNLQNARPPYSSLYPSVRPRQHIAEYNHFTDPDQHCYDPQQPLDFSPAPGRMTEYPGQRLEYSSPNYHAQPDYRLQQQPRLSATAGSTGAVDYTHRGATFHTPAGQEIGCEASAGQCRPMHHTAADLQHLRMTSFQQAKLTDNRSTAGAVPLAAAPTPPQHYYDSRPSPAIGEYPQPHAQQPNNTQQPHVQQQLHLQQPPQHLQQPPQHLQHPQQLQHLQQPHGQQAPSQTVPQHQQHIHHHLHQQQQQHHPAYTLPPGCHPQFNSTRQVQQQYPAYYTPTQQSYGRPTDSSPVTAAHSLTSSDQHRYQYTGQGSQPTPPPTPKIERQQYAPQQHHTQQPVEHPGHHLVQHPVQHSSQQLFSQQHHHPVQQQHYFQQHYPMNVQQQPTPPAPAKSLPAAPQQQRQPPVATVSATVRNNSTSASVTKNQQQPLANTSSSSSKLSAAVQQQRPTFPWLQNGRGSKFEKAVNMALKQQKPVGVALVSFKTTPAEQQQQQPYKSAEPLKFNLATHPFPHLAAAAAAASAAKATMMPFKFRTKAELKQMNLTPPPPPLEPIITEEKWVEWSASFKEDWESFMADLRHSDNIKRVCRVTKTVRKSRPPRKVVAQVESASPAGICKRIEDYSSDEDIPLSLRQKMARDRQRQERLLHRRKDRKRCHSDDSSSDSFQRTRGNKKGKNTPRPDDDDRRKKRTPKTAKNGRHRCQQRTKDDKITTKHIRCTNTSCYSMKKAPVVASISWHKRWRMLRSSLLLVLHNKRQRLKSASAKSRHRRRSRRRTKIVVGGGSLAGRGPMLVQDRLPEKVARLPQQRVIRRRFRSGMDLIRKNKKKKAATTQQHVNKRPKAPVKAYHISGSTMDAATEIRSWVVNKSLGESTLHRASRLGYLEGVEYLLLQPGCNVSAKDNAGYTPLHVACSRGHLQVAKKLLQYGADESSSAQGGVRPLHEAVENDHVELVRLLLSYGADATLVTYGGQSPVTLSSSDSMRRFLAAHIADVRGSSTESWIFDGSASFMDCPDVGWEPLNSSYVQDFSMREITVECSHSFAAVDVQIYQLTDRSANPWLRLDDAVQLLNCRADWLVGQLAESARIQISRLKLSQIAVPLVKKRARDHDDQDNCVLVHYNDQLRQLLAIEHVSLSL